MSGTRVWVARVCVILTLLAGGVWAADARETASLPVSKPVKQDSGLAELQRRFARLERAVPGRLGVAVLHVESGRTVAWRGREPFSMASVMKLPLAVVALDAVERGALALDEGLTVRAADLRPVGPLAERQGVVGSAVPVRDLIEAMLIESDNTAADLLLARLGGPVAVTARLRELGIAGVRIDRPELGLMADSVGFAIPSDQDRTLAELERRMAAVGPKRRAEAARRFAQDPRDRASPLAMAQLLARLQRGTVLSDSSRRLLLGAMERCRTGPGRLRGQLPPRTVVAHKTGTNGSSVNDVGLITLPAGKGHLAVAVFVHSAQATTERREEAIARAARLAYETFSAQRSGG